MALLAERASWQSACGAVRLSGMLVSLTFKAVSFGSPSDRQYLLSAAIRMSPDGP